LELVSLTNAVVLIEVLVFLAMIICGFNYIDGTFLEIDWRTCY